MEDFINKIQKTRDLTKKLTREELNNSYEHSLTVGDIFQGEYYKKMIVEGVETRKNMVGAEYRMAILLEDEELEIAMNHYNFLRKYNLV